MQYLYKGSTEELSVEATDILELMAAANFFQLDGLLHYCEVRCASLIDLDNIVSYYIHAKVSLLAPLLSTILLSMTLSDGTQSLSTACCSSRESQPKPQLRLIYGTLRGVWLWCRSTQNTATNISLSVFY